MVSVQQKFPFPWRGLYVAMTKAEKVSVHTLNAWLERAASRNPRLSWAALADCLIAEEPLLDSSSGKLVFVPVFQHLAPLRRHLLLAFLYGHREKIPVNALESLVTVIPREDHSELPQPTENDTDQTLLENRHWSEYWHTKFNHYIQERNGQSNCQAGSSVLSPVKSERYQFSTDNHALKSRLLERLRTSSTAMGVRNPWRDSNIWEKRENYAGQKNETQVISGMPDEECDDVEMTDTASISHHSSVFSSQRKRNAQDVDDSDLDSFMFTQCVQEPRSKVTKIDVSDSEEEDLNTSGWRENVGEHLMSRLTHMKESWHCVPPDKVTDDDLSALTQISSNQLCSVVEYLDFESLPEGNLSLVAEQIAGLKETLSLLQAGHLTKACLLHRLSSLSESGSRAFHQSFASLSLAFTSEIIQGILVPVLQSPSLGTHQSDFIVKVVKEDFPPEQQERLLRCYLGSDVTLSAQSISLLQTVIDAKISLANETIGLLVASFLKASQPLQDNLKFGKALLALVKNYGQQFSSSHITNLLQASENHKTFLKKSISASLKKLQKSS